MAGFDSEVYDILQPTPVSLKDLSAIAVSLGIWRCEVMKYLRMDDALDTFNPKDKNVSSKSLLPDLPSVIRATIDKSVTKLGFSMGHWLRSHHERVFHFHYSHQNHVLRYFKDFVCDYNGTIHYSRTAECMMRCDQFDMQQKFIIACTYFFEDDIKRLWPLVSSNMDLNKNIHFYKSPQLYYWICYLKNELEKIPTTNWDNLIEGVMLSNCMTHNIPSVQYFWNRIPPESRVQKAHSLVKSDVQSFTRYILPKLDDQQLDEFVNENGFEILHNLYSSTRQDKELVLSIWMRIRDIINESAFLTEIMVLLQFETGKNLPLGYKYCEECVDDDEDDCTRRWLNMCCEIWNSAPERLKRSAVRDITSSNDGELRCDGFKNPLEPKEFIFFSTFLSYATYDERRTFWSNYWGDLMEDTRPVDLQKMVNLCFENEDEANQFKENVMANSIRVLSYFRQLLCIWFFDELNDWASFLFSNVQAARNFKQQLLQEYFLGRDNGFPICIKYDATGFNQFIEDAYADADLSANFKNQMVSSPRVQESLLRNALNLDSEKVIEFLNVFVLAEDTLQQLKARIVDALKEIAAARKSVVSESWFTSVLSWCLGSDYEVEKFKGNYL